MKKTKKAEITRNGKIARLPAEIRDELCERLLNGARGPAILAWVNKLPATRRMLKQDYRSQDITAENLSNWRQGGFLDWRARRDHLEYQKELSTHLSRIARVSGNRMSEGAAVQATGLISQTLDVMVHRLAADPEAKPDLDELTNLARALTQLRQAEVAQQRADLDVEKLKRVDAQIELERAKFHHAARAGLQKILEDEATRAILAAPGGQDEKIEALGRSMFGDLWNPKTA